MYGLGDEPLYVGKSVRLRTRLLSYFRAPRGEKAWELIQETSRIEWDYSPNEYFSLIQEMKLIQRWQPHFNVQHKHRRMYSFVKITREPAPRRSFWWRAGFDSTRPSTAVLWLPTYGSGSTDRANDRAEARPALPCPRHTSKGLCRMPASPRCCGAGAGLSREAPVAAGYPHPRGLGSHRLRRGPRVPPRVSCERVRLRQKARCPCRLAS
jgi:hypothetical protein